jgi:hypothetical protein
MPERISFTLFTVFLFLRSGPFPVVGQSSGAPAEQRQELRPVCLRLDQRKTEFIRG